MHGVVLCCHLSLLVVVMLPPVPRPETRVGGFDLTAPDPGCEACRLSVCRVPTPFFCPASPPLPNKLDGMGWNRTRHARLAGCMHAVPPQRNYESHHPWTRPEHISRRACNANIIRIAKRARAEPQTQAWAMHMRAHVHAADLCSGRPLLCVHANAFPTANACCSMAVVRIAGCDFKH